MSYGLTEAEQDITEEVVATVDDPAYEDLSVVNVSTEADLRTFVLRGVDTNRIPTVIHITATVAPEDTSPSWNLADRIATRITERYGVNATVEVRYIDYSGSQATNTTGSSAL